MKLGLKPSEKLTYDEAFSMFVSLENGGIVNDVIGFHKDDCKTPTMYDYRGVLYKIREDLYAVLSVDFVDY